MAIRTLLKGMGLGAGLMYLWDPQSGRRRRALLLDQWDHATHCSQDFLDKAQRDLSNRAAGAGAEARSLLHRDDADDRVLAARVRAKLGRYCSHPHAVAVEAKNGHVIIHGQALATEVGDLLKAVCSVRGVQRVENHLEAYRQGDGISALQGGAPPAGEPFAMLQENWSPATRVVGQLAGATLMGNCLAQRSLSSMLLGAVGFGLFVRGTTNRSLAQLVGAPTCPQAVHVQRSVTIHAPIEKVWDFLTDFEQVARFLPNVAFVESLGDDHYRWGLRLPTGQEMEIEERVTERVPEERLSWESVSNHPVSYCGTLGLQRQAEDVTQVNIGFDYTPPGGAVGAALASLLSLDASSQFQQAVMRIKPFLETGAIPHDLHEVSSRPGRVDQSRQGGGQSGQSYQSGQTQPQSVQAQPQPVQGRPSQLSRDMPAPAEPLAPEQIPPVHTQSQIESGADHPERGRLG